MPETLVHARGTPQWPRGNLETMPFPVFFMSHTDLLQTLLPPLLEDGRRADVGTGPGLEKQPEDNFEDRLVADIKHLHFLQSLSNNAIDARCS